MTESIKAIGEHNISDEKLYKAVYKAMGFRRRFSNNINRSYIKENLIEKTLIYHPVWLVKSLIIAARPPLKPKKIPRMIFVDAVSGYRGIFSHVPPLREVNASSNQVVKPFLKDEDVTPYVKDVQEKQINRQYVLKKPTHEVIETSLVHLPIYKMVIRNNDGEETLYINANTGESEQFMSERWAEQKDILK